MSEHFRVIAAAEEPAADTLEAVREGIGERCFILRGMFDPGRLAELKSELHASSRHCDAENLPLVRGCANHHRLVQTPYDSDAPTFRREFINFHWNEGWSDLNRYGRVLANLHHAIIGLDPSTAIEAGDGRVTMFRVHHYPAGGGFCGPRVGDVNGVEMSLLLSQYGEDYRSGGLFYIDRGNRHHFVDAQTRFGDLIILPAGSVWGVYPIDVERPVDLLLASGRWSLTTPVVTLEGAS